jgi:hypothetical protein
LEDVAIKPETIPSGAPMKVRSGGNEWIYDTDTIAGELNLLHANGLDELRWLKALVLEKSIHIPQLLLAGLAFKAKYTVLLDLLPLPLRGIIGLTYYGGRDADGELPPQTRMVEYERMVIQYRETGTTTEELLGRDISAIRPYLAGPQPQEIEDNIDLVLVLRNAGPENFDIASPAAATPTTRQQLLEQFARNRPLRPEEQEELIRLQKQSRMTPPPSPEIEGAMSRRPFTPSPTNHPL